MSNRDSLNIYDKIHSIQIFSKNGFVENRSINVNIIDFKDYIQIKLKDGTDFVFNYTVHIDLRYFETMRNEQCLDIGFEEFKTNLIDMLQQVQRQEMFLKCEITESNCKMLFYGKSKIKSIVYLSVDLQLTNQKEIFDEMNKSIMDLQAINKNLNSQIHLIKQLLNEKDGELKEFDLVNKKLKQKFLDDIKQINTFFTRKLDECSKELLEKFLKLSLKLLKLSEDIKVVKSEAALKSDSSARLLQSMENLRLESLETTKILNELKRENCNLKSIQFNNEKAACELRETLSKKEREYKELEKLKDELERDVRQATMIIAQKQTANEELAKDVVQANQMLVNFNHLFDTKNEEIEELKNSNNAKERIIYEQNQRFLELKREYEEYQSKFNLENHNKLSHELFAANKRIEEIEKLNRETVKLNELLTRKLASGDFARSYR